MKPYCTQNNGDCTTCSLVNYNRDCQNNPLHGGKREGAGRKQYVDDTRKLRAISMSDSEWEQIKRMADELQISASEYIRSKVL